MAKAFDQMNPGGLSGEWKSRTDEALAELNKDVFGGGEKSASADSAAAPAAPAESALPDMSAHPAATGEAPPGPAPPLPPQPSSTP